MNEKKTIISGQVGELDFKLQGPPKAVQRAFNLLMNQVYPKIVVDAADAAPEMPELFEEDEMIPKQAGVRRLKSGRWYARRCKGNRQFSMGTFDDLADANRAIQIGTNVLDRYSEAHCDNFFIEIREYIDLAIQAAGLKPSRKFSERTVKSVES